MNDFLNKGDIISFGSWKQKSLEWYVILENRDYYLLHMAYGIQTMPYDSEGHHVEWETSAPRHFLYDVFLPTAFTQQEAKKIVNKRVIVEKNIRENNPDQYEIEERIFLLSEKELLSCNMESSKWIRRLGAWWLRSYGRLENFSMGIVRPDGVVYPSGDIRAQNVMIVPAICVEKNIIGEKSNWQL